MALISCLASESNTPYFAYASLTMTIDARSPTQGTKGVNAPTSNGHQQNGTEPDYANFVNPLVQPVSDLRHLLDEVYDTISPWIDGLPNAPGWPALDGLAPARHAELLAPPPDEPEDYKSVIDQCFRAGLESPELQSGNMVAYVPGHNMPDGAVGELISQLMGRYVAVRMNGPGLAAVEDGLIQWMCSLFKFPKTAHGVLTSGGTTAILNAVIAAREAFIRRGGEISKARIYVSDQVHGCVVKTCHIAGFPPTALVKVASDQDFRIDLGALERIVEQDMQEGYQPCIFFANGGTTNTGAIDPIKRIAEMAARRQAWVHVDACYGGFFVLTRRGSEMLDECKYADSISLDAHKSLFACFGVGALIVKDISVLAAGMDPSFREADYLRDLPFGTTQSTWPVAAETSVEFSRGERGLRLWFPLKRYGVEAYRQVLEEKLWLAEYMAEELGKTPNLLVPFKPTLSIVVVRLKEGDNASFVAKVSARTNTSYIASSTVLNGEEYARFCILQYRTSKANIDHILGEVRRIAEEVSGGTR